MSSKLEYFSLKYHRVGKACENFLTLAGSISATHNIYRLERSLALIYLVHFKIREHLVDLALNLNVLAVFAVFTFVGALLLGAF